MIGAAKESLRDLIQRTSGTLTQWATAAAPFNAPELTVPTGMTFAPGIPTATSAGLAGKAHIYLRITGVPKLGEDETRRTFDEDDDVLVSTICGLRTYAISVTCTTFSDSVKAAEILELLRTRFGRLSVLTQLRALNMSVVKLEPIIELVPLSGLVSQAVLDMKIGWAINDEDTTDTGDYIDTAQITTTWPAPEVLDHPAPELTSLSLTYGFVVGGRDLLVYGKNFISGTQVQVDGDDVPTTYLAPTRCLIHLSSTITTTPGAKTVTAVNPAPGGGTSNELYYTVNGGALVEVVPSTAVQWASEALPLTVTGLGFEDGMIVSVGGVELETTFVDSTLLTAVLPKANAIAGGHAVSAVAGVHAVEVNGIGGISFTVTPFSEADLTYRTWFIEPENWNPATGVYTATTGPNATQAVGSARPSLTASFGPMNSRPMVDYDGVNHHIDGPTMGSIVTTSNIVVLAAYYADAVNTPGSGPPFNRDQVWTESGGYFGLGLGSDGSADWYHYAPDYSMAEISMTQGAGAGHIAYTRFRSSDTSLRIKSGLGTESVNLSAGAGTFAVSMNGAFRMGMNWSATQRLEGKIGKILVCNGDEPQANLDRILCKWEVYYGLLTP